MAILPTIGSKLWGQKLNTAVTAVEALANAALVVANASIPFGMRGAANGVAALDAGSKVPVAQVPDLSASKVTSGTVADARLPSRLSAETLAGTYASQMDGTGQTLAALNAWLATASPLGIKRLTGTVTLTGPLVLNTANTYLDVSGTTLNTSGDYPAITSLNAQAVSVANCKVVNSFTGTRTTYDVDITNPTKPNLINVEINLPNTSTAMGGIRIRYDSGQAGNNFMPILDKVWIRNGHLVLDGVTDGKVSNTFVWAPNTGALGAVQMINSANGWTFTGCDVIPPVGDAPAGYYMNNCAHNRIVGGYIDGNNAGIMTGNGAVLINCLRISFSGVGFWNLGRSAANLNGCIGTVFSGCTFSKNNKVDNFWPDLSLTGSSATVVVGNTFSSLDARTNKGAIYVEDATSFDNLFDLNTVEWHSGVQYYASPFVTMQGTSTQGTHNKPETAFSYAKAKSITATYGVPKEDLFQGNALLCSGTFTVTLPTTASLHSGDSIVIKNVGTGVITVATTSAQVIDGGPTSITMQPGRSVTLLSQGGSGWRTVAAQAIGVPAVVPPASLISVPAATAWPAANTAIFHFFTVTAPTALRYLNFRLDSASGNYQLALVRMDSATAYTRIADTGVIAQPTAGDKTIDLGATYLDPGEYAVVMWMDNTTATVRYASNSGLTASRLTASVASLASGVPSSGTLTRGSTNYVGGMNLTAV